MKSQSRPKEALKKKATKYPAQRDTTKFSYENLTPFNIHHDRNSKALLLIQSPHTLNNAAMPLTCTMAHVDTRHIHSTNCERLQLLEPTRGWANRAHKLRPPRASESVLLQVGFRHRIHIDRARIGWRRNILRGCRRKNPSLTVIGDQHFGGRIRIEI